MYPGTSNFYQPKVLASWKASDDEEGEANFVRLRSEGKQEAGSEKGVERRHVLTDKMV